MTDEESMNEVNAEWEAMARKHPGFLGFIPCTLTGDGHSYPVGVHAEAGLVAIVQPSEDGSGVDAIVLDPEQASQLVTILTAWVSKGSN